jgi:chemotaxis protein histidine kinase CheA
VGELQSSFEATWDSSTSDLQDLRAAVLAAWQSVVGVLGESKSFEKRITSWPARYEDLGSLAPILDAANITASSFSIGFWSIGNQSQVNWLLQALTICSLGAIGNLGWIADWLCQAVDGLGDQLATQGFESQLEAIQAQVNAEAYADQVATTLVGDERAEREQDIQTVQQRATAQFNQAESNITQAEQNATDQFNQAQQEIQALQSGLQQEAQAREQGDQEQQQYADQQAQQAEQDAESHADLEVAAATAAAAAALAAEAAALEAEIAAVEAEVAGLVGLAGDAILGGALLTLIEDGLLFGFLAAAVKDPKQTADASVGALDPIMELAGGALDALIGWAA